MPEQFTQVVPIPFHAVENEHWKSFFNKIRSAWKIPSYYVLPNNYLESEFSSIKNKVDSKISDSYRSWSNICDGWTSIRRESIINYVITTPQPLFYETFSTGGESHTAIFIAKEISVVLNEVGPKKYRG